MAFRMKTAMHPKVISYKKERRRSELMTLRQKHFNYDLRIRGESEMTAFSLNERTNEM
jgi:hypothetical protein